MYSAEVSIQLAHLPTCANFFGYARKGSRMLNTVDSSGIAALLHKSPKTFRNIRPLLHAAGLPQPLALPGNPVWLAAEIDAWLESRSLNRRDGGTTAPTLDPEPVRRSPDLRGRPSRTEQMAAAAVGLSVKEYRRQQRGGV